MYLLARGNKATTHSKRDNIMSNSKLFKTAHKLTKKSIQAGESYQVNFGQWLKVLFAQEKIIANFDIQSIGSATQEILNNADVQAFAQAKVSTYNGKIQTINFDALVNANIDEYSALRFEDAIAGIKMYEKAGRCKNVQSSLREALTKLALTALSVDGLWNL